VKRLLLIAALILASVPAQVAAQGGPLGALPIDNIKCEGMEGAVVHIHQHIQLFDRGRNIEVPAQIGIPPGANCLYWVHTHTNDGLIHNESPNRRVFTLGNFFDVWGQELSWYVAGPVHAVAGHKLVIQVNGHGYKGKDPRNIPLTNHEEIVIQSGPPWARTVKKIKWGTVG
jgi:hypothetical protein